MTKEWQSSIHGGYDISFGFARLYVTPNLHVMGYDAYFNGKPLFNVTFAEPEQAQKKAIVGARRWLVEALGELDKYIAEHPEKENEA